MSGEAIMGGNGGSGFGDAVSNSEVQYLATRIGDRVDKLFPEFIN